MVYVEQTEQFIADEEIYALFPEQYLGYVPPQKAAEVDYAHCSWENTGLSEGYKVPKKPQPVEIDDELGLEIVQPTEQPSMEEKYGVSNLPDSSFITSLRTQYDSKGYLSPKQIACLRK